MEYCKKKGILWDAPSPQTPNPATPGGKYTKALFDEEARRVDESVSPGRSAVRLWTSAQKLRGEEKEFCSIVNEVAREDWPEMMDCLASIVRAINQECCVTNRRGGPAAAPRPIDGVCFRGGGFKDDLRGFFAPGKQFRQPAFLATSFAQSVAQNFIGFQEKTSTVSRVLWQIHVPDGCLHANLIPSDLTHVDGEQEYLFAPYSAFQVRSTTWRSGTVADPHVIELDACVDNKAAPLGLPLAPWS